VRFDPDATAFMVRETLIMAVCKKCLTDEERKELDSSCSPLQIKRGADTLRRPAAVADSAS
jgi:hypothetical protein